MECYRFLTFTKTVFHLHWNKIIAGCKQQNPQSQEELYRGYHAGMFKLCIRYATDTEGATAIFNEAMLKVFKTLHQFADRGDFIAWVRRIVVNTCIDHCRRQAKFNHSAIDQVPDDLVSLNPDIYERLKWVLKIANSPDAPTVSELSRLTDSAGMKLVFTTSDPDVIPTS